MESRSIPACDLLAVPAVGSVSIAPRPSSEEKRITAFATNRPLNQGVRLRIEAVVAKMFPQPLKVLRLCFDRYEVAWHCSMLP